MALQYNTGPTAPASSLGLASLFSSTMIGPDTSNTFVLTTMGLAVLRPDGTCVGIDRDRDALIDLTAFAVPGMNAGVFRLPRPLASVRRGDIFMTPGANPQPLFVLGLEDDARISALDPIEGEFVTYTPPINPFLNFAVVAVSIYDMLFRSLASGEDDDDALGGLGLLPLLLLVQAAQAPAVPTPTGTNGTNGTTTTSPPPNSMNALLLALAMSGSGAFGLGGTGEGSEERSAFAGLDNLLPVVLLASGGGLFGAGGGANPLLALLLMQRLGRGDEAHERTARSERAQNADRAERTAPRPRRVTGGRKRKR